MEQKYCKLYHRGYQTIDELYDDLKDAVIYITMKDSRIVVSYHSQILEIELSASGGYYTYHNGKKDQASWDDQDLYSYVLAFVHGQRKDIGELVICDTQIRELSSGGFTYLDEMGRDHHVEYAVAARNCEQGVRCVGQRNVTQRYIAFCSDTVGLKVLFKRPFVLSRKHCLTGSRATRFTALQKHIAENGYSSYAF